MLLFSAAPGPESGLETLTARIAQGDRTALGELYHRAKGAVYALALSYMKSHSDAEDITQNVFLRAWEQAAQFSGQGKALNWLLAITRNLCRMELRRKQQQRQLPWGMSIWSFPPRKRPSPRRTGKSSRRCSSAWSPRSARSSCFTPWPG